MNYIVAVSGGVDSVVLLHMLKQSKYKLIVAHVDHGMRIDSTDDARFVEGLAKLNHLPFVSTQLSLGKKASEEQARKERYEFLFDQAAQHKATVVTAHHADDMVETVALNLERGTGWRGLAVLDRANVYRPLLTLPKDKLYDYALKHRLEWVEDGTNRTNAYLRNRLRSRIGRHEQHRVVANLRTVQQQLAKSINYESRKIIGRNAGSRHFLTQLPEVVAIELLGTEIQDKTGIRPMRPQLRRAVMAIKTAKANTTHQVGSGIILTFTSRKYYISVV